MFHNFILQYILLTVTTHHSICKARLSNTNKMSNIKTNRIQNPFHGWQTFWLTQNLADSYKESVLEYIKLHEIYLLMIKWLQQTYAGNMDLIRKPHIILLPIVRSGKHRIQNHGKFADCWLVGCDTMWFAKSTLKFSMAVESFETLVHFYHTLCHHMIVTTVRILDATWRVQSMWKAPVCVSPVGCTLECKSQCLNVRSVEQKSIGLKFSKSRTGSHVTYSCYHNSSGFTFPIFLHSWHLSVFHSKEGNYQKLKTDLAVTIQSLTLSWVEVKSLYCSILTVSRHNPGSWMRASSSLRK